MKKVSAILVALLLVAATAITAFAAGINDSEQAVLDELKTSVTMKGTEMVWPDAYINQAENYFNTIDLTADQSKEIIALIKEGKTALEGTGAANIADTTKAQKDELFTLLKKAVAVVDGTASYDKTTREVSVFDADGKVILKVVPTLVAKGSGQAVDSNGKAADNGVIKTTGAGADYTAIVLVGAAAALIIAGGVFFVVKKRA